MKRILGALALAALLLTPQAAYSKTHPKAHPKAQTKAQTSHSTNGWPAFLVPPQTTQSVLLNPFFWWGNAGISYERSINPDYSWNIGLDGGFWGFPNSYYRMVGLSGGASWWLNKDFWKHPQPQRLGWYVGPQLHLRNVALHYDFGTTSYDVSGNYFGLGGQGGYQWIFAPGLTARLLGEAGFLGGSLDTRPGYSAAYGGLYANASVAAGWSF